MLLDCSNVHKEKHFGGDEREPELPRSAAREPRRRRAFARAASSRLLKK